MDLREIIDAVQPVEVYGERNVKIASIVNNSKDAVPGSLFVCITGYRRDGHLYAHEAVKNGAVAIISGQKLDVPVTQLVVENPRLAQALACLKLYDYPSNKLNLVGITGTNGKTTISCLAEAIFRAAGHTTGLIGTINNKVHNSVVPARLTTPDTLELGRLFLQMLEHNVQTVVMEVSSHALELHRVTGYDFDVAVFSNISRDHYDFHHNFHNYVNAKARLFLNQCSWGGRPPRERYAVINTDDPYGRSMIKAAQASNIYSYGFNPGARVRADGHELKAGGSIFKVKADNRHLTIELPMPGLFNISNALAAIAVGLCFEVGLDIIQQALHDFEGVPGRCEYINCGQEYYVMVDFAHNPDGLYNLLTAIPYPNTASRKILVFGCEGGKDRGKRGLMGGIAAEHADYCVITSDNIYQEDPLDVARDIESGFLRAGLCSSRYKIILDRYQAIQYAMGLACPGDTVIIAGKGHETRQVVKNRSIPFDDRVVIREILGQRAASAL